MNAKLRWVPFELHPETPPEGAPKPFPEEQWPMVRAQLIRTAESVGLPMDPPERNVNSRRALEIGELVRERAGDDASSSYHHAVSRAFFVDGANVADLDVIGKFAQPHGVSQADVAAAWSERRYDFAVDEFMRQAFHAGVRGVPAFARPGQPAIIGMMRPEELIRELQR